MNYPWTNLAKKLQKRFQKADDMKTIRIDDIDEWFDRLRNQRIPWYEQCWHRAERWFNDVVWDVYRWFKPCHQPVRDAVPRRWMDCPELILQVNFAIIQEFVEHEMDSVVWDDDDRPTVKEAGEWLKMSYKYITEERALLQQQISEALRVASEMPAHERKQLTYHQRYGRVNDLEAEMENRDQQVLEGLAKHRQWMWT